MPREHADLPRRARHDQHLGLALEHRASGVTTETWKSRVVGQIRLLGVAYAASFSPSCLPRSTACSIGPTM